jgi:hypothetical protein
MKNRSHNKKRNVGLIYEQLVNHMCQCIIQNDENNTVRASQIIKENFKKNTQLHRELKFFNALIQTRGIDPSLATSIINEAKSACQRHFSNEDLEKEKSVLIKSLNYSFGKGNLFESKVKNYKMLATVQTLLNEWRKGSEADFEITTQYEKILHEWMTSQEEIIKEERLVESNIDELTFRMMNERFNKKYENLLNEDQKKIIRLFIESKNKDDNELIEQFEEIKVKSTRLLEGFKLKCDSTILLENYHQIKQNINKLDTNLTTEDNLKKFLTLCKLNEELKGDR